MPNAEAQCTVEGREEAKGQRRFFTFKFFLSCHKMCYFTVPLPSPLDMPSAASVRVLGFRAEQNCELAAEERLASAEQGRPGLGVAGTQEGRGNCMVVSLPSSQSPCQFISSYPEAV